MPEPTTATRLGARPPDFAAIAIQGVLYIFGRRTNHKQQRYGNHLCESTPAKSPSRMRENSPEIRGEHTKGVQGAMSQWFAQSPREEAASPLVRTADLAAGLAGHTPVSHHGSVTGSSASIRMCTLGF